MWADLCQDAQADVRTPGPMCAKEGEDHGRTGDT